jgi:cytidine deaminase
LKKLEYNTTILEFASAEELSSEDQHLILMAREAAEVAYAPYSNFQVGAALMLENGKCVKGCNQENVAYPSGLCAERVAVFASYAQYPGIVMNTIAITAKSKNFIVDNPITPCGSCRQVLAEYEHLQGSPIRVILTGETGKVLVIQKIEDILPLSFKEEKLKK